MAKKRKEVLAGKTLKAKTMCGSFYLTLNEDEGLQEVKLQMGKSGSCIRSMLELIGILISIILQEDNMKDKVHRLVKKHMIGVACGNSFFCKEDDKQAKYTSCLDYTGKKVAGELDRDADS